MLIALIVVASWGIAAPECDIPPSWKEVLLAVASDQSKAVVQLRKVAAESGRNGEERLAKGLLEAWEKSGKRFEWASPRLVDSPSLSPEDVASVSPKLAETRVVAVQVEVSPDGCVRDASIRGAPLDEKLRDLVLSRVRRARFVPKFQQGRPVTGRSFISITLEARDAPSS
jgi:TonB family protein